MASLEKMVQIYFERKAAVKEAKKEVKSTYQKLSVLEKAQGQMGLDIAKILCGMKSPNKWHGVAVQGRRNEIIIVEGHRTSGGSLQFRHFRAEMIDHE